MMRNMRRGIPSLMKRGTEHLTGLEQTILKNIEACQDLSKITRTSLGPNGMNKMVINHLEKLFVTSDAATIMRELEVVHPAAKMLVMAAHMQEQEIGDGSNLVVSLAGELLKKAEELILMGIHPSELIKGYELAGSKAQEIIDTLAVWTPSPKELFKKEILAKGIMAAMASKQYGEEKFLAPLVAEACLNVMPENTYNFNVDNVRVLKVLGGGLHQSTVVNGMAMKGAPSAWQNGQTLEKKNVKVAVFTISIDNQATETKGTVLIHNADELVNYNIGEEKLLEDTVKALAESGIGVVVCGEKIGDMAIHFLDKYNIMGLKINSKFQLRRLCRAIRATPLVQMQHVHPDDQGFCSRVYVKEIGLQKVVVFEQEEKDASAVSTIILRGSTHNILNDVERATDDGVNVVKAMGRNAEFLAGAGANDIELARLLHAYGDKHAGIEQYAINAFADAFEVVPRTLAQNAGVDAMDLISQLYAAHEKGDATIGIDIEEHGVTDVAKKNIFDHLFTKKNAIKLAAHTVTTILRVDQIIRSKPAGGPKMGQRKGHWDDDD